MRSASLRDSSIKTLVLYAQYTTRLSYCDDWLDAFAAAPDFAVSSLNICSPGIKRKLRRHLRDADLVVLLHSTNADTSIYLEPLVAELRHRRGMFLSFVGNEVNIPGSPIAAKRRVLAAIEPDFIATQLTLEAGDFLFGDLVRRRVVSLPHALNPRAFSSGISQADRPIDIGVRAARYVPHLGDDDRNRLHDFFAERAFDPEFRVDIGSQRFDRSGWADFLNRCKATVSSEAGSWYLERDDETVEAIRWYVDERFAGRGIVVRNDSMLRRLGHKMPWAVRAGLRRIMSRGLVRHESMANEAIPFDEIFERFFRCRPRCPAYGKCISSRHFDAIGTKTVQIMFPGRFNDILVADQHYIALAPDFSNFDDVMDRFADLTYRQAMADRAHDYVMADHTYEKRMAQLQDIVATTRA